ncbi:conserved hypothetical protein [Perkinsus marinus ATCC 50983]|uniref:Gamma-interferon-inducible lysosomal thiol reductase n=1 Tax=Perkinsus marinus (strain ATCC 50983 / TXsc) TaxID=423536 RepID=C5KDN3_PERM5|nr:conserved hypothetical protein [Perkinsus marinus ATCC 50983]EER17336.1 conserved hypothetical protein [Perkinsus marinus ATCC 50983]|eukprot:XP_002785540.1 conserved hypothetical protein [Perkinsus marinus ATCC 50983]
MAAQLEQERGQLRRTLFYETLCPYCQRFMVDQVAPIVDDPETAEFVDLDLELIPYGNVRNGKCQHGPIECEGNAYHRCIIGSSTYSTIFDNFTIDVLDYDPAKYLPAILCMEEAFKNYNFTGMDHAARLGEVHRCYTSPERSAKLEEAAKKETESLDPPKQFVPWLTDVKGHQLPDVYADFKGYVCGYLKNNSYAMPPVCRPTISLNLYYGSLDPASVTFITEQLNPALSVFQRFVNFNISLVPYGRTVPTIGGGATCIHGVSECALNAYERCVIDAFHKDPGAALATVGCMTDRLQNFDNVTAFWFQYQLEAVAAGCIGAIPAFTGAKFGEVEQCHYNSTMTAELSARAGNATARVSLPTAGGPLLTEVDGTALPPTVYTDFQGYLRKFLADGDFEQPPISSVTATG